LSSRQRVNKNNNKTRKENPMIQNIGKRVRVVLRKDMLAVGLTKGQDIVHAGIFWNRGWIATGIFSQVGGFQGVKIRWQTGEPIRIRWIAR
jgi:hypothetical protein